jgi:hypothetical protein
VNLQEIREQTWSILETDKDEFPAALIDAFAVDGFNRIVATERRWPHWQTAANVTVEAGVDSVAISGPEFDTQLREVTSLVHVAAKERLYQRPYRDAIEVYGEDRGTPEAWSVWGDRIYLWPIPESDVTLRAVGYRAPQQWWTDPSAIIDCDDALHMAILYFTLSRCFARMEDTELSGFYEQMFVSGVQTVVQQVMARNTTDDPLILHGGGKRVLLDRPNLNHGF